MRAGVVGNHLGTLPVDCPGQRHEIGPARGNDLVRRDGGADDIDLGRQIADVAPQSINIFINAGDRSIHFGFCVNISEFPYGIRVRLLDGIFIRNCDQLCSAVRNRFNVGKAFVNAFCQDIGADQRTLATREHAHIIDVVLCNHDSELVFRSCNSHI